MTSTQSIAKDGFTIARNVLHSNAITHLVATKFVETKPAFALHKLPLLHFRTRYVR